MIAVELILTEKMVQIEVDIDDRDFLYVAKMAHERDITFNEMMNRIIEWHIQEEQERGKSDNR